LLKAGAHVVAVERDRRCLPALAELGAVYPDRLRVIEGDALAVPLEDALPQGGHIVANLPYNVGTALLVNWLSAAPLSNALPHPKTGSHFSGKGLPWPPRWASLTLMFQREVAERIVAAPNTDHYGRLAILSQWRTEVQIAMNVHRSAFTPPPKVMSAVVHLTPAAMPEGVDPVVLERLTAAAFGQRRKMLRQSLKGVAGALDALDALGIDPTRRAETLSVEDFVALARALT
jgi:16S rRNA (adenine1518-N6/adenine1519-N6)-dimethyltransferase